MSGIFCQEVPEKNKYVGGVLQEWLAAFQKLFHDSPACHLPKM